MLQGGQTSKGRHFPGRLRSRITQTLRRRKNADRYQAGALANALEAAQGEVHPDGNEQQEGDERRGDVDEVLHARSGAAHFPWAATDGGMPPSSVPAT